MEGERKLNEERREDRERKPLRIDRVPTCRDPVIRVRNGEES